MSRHHWKRWMDSLRHARASDSDELKLEKRLAATQMTSELIADLDAMEPAEIEQAKTRVLSYIANRRSLRMMTVSDATKHILANNYNEFGPSWLVWLEAEQLTVYHPCCGTPPL